MGFHQVKTETEINDKQVKINNVEQKESYIIVNHYYDTGPVNLYGTCVDKN